MTKVHNFSAGPSILPQSVLQQAQEAISNFDGLNLSLLEISHRSANFEAVLEEARQLVLELLGLDTSYEVLFLQGGASLQFLMLPYNFLNTKACYVNTGTWATKAIEQAHAFGTADVIASSEDQNFNYLPSVDALQIDPSADYLHITSNNTIYGTQFKSFPKTEVPLIVDMSSDIFSKPIDAKQFTVIYAGAQKNLGPAGVTLAIIKKEFLNTIQRSVPAMLDYRIHAKNGSMYNTPPVFAIYVSLLTLRWLKAMGGLETMGQLNTSKAELLYKAIDQHPLFEATIKNPADRSQMNVNFILKDASHTERFDTLCKTHHISGLKGHRSVGGYRASLYNALPIESVQALIDVMNLV